MQLGCAETKQMEIDIEQRAKTDRTDHCADTDLPAEQKAGDDYKNLDACAAQADRPAGFARQRNHKRVARPCTCLLYTS